MYFKGAPEDFVIRHRSGRVVASGRGLSFWYLSYNTSIALVPVTSLDSPFIFQETSSDFQDLTLQGSVGFRIADPLKAAERFDFSLKGSGRQAILGDGREKITERLMVSIQSQVRQVIAPMTLEQALAVATTLGAQLTEQVRGDTVVEAAGLHIEGVVITAARPTPEIRQALQTDYREGLQKQADQAIFARRAHALQQEKSLKETEVATEIELAERRKLLVDTEARNRLTLAEASAKAQEKELAVYNAASPQLLASLALRSWAEKGGSVGNISISPDMLTNVLSQLAGSSNSDAKAAQPKPSPTKPAKR